MREPVSRLISWYRFTKQRGFLSNGIITIDDYIKRQLHNSINSSTPQHMRALDQGRYSVYLNPYYELYEPGRIFVMFFEDINRSPITIVNELCEFTGIDPTYYQEFDFKIYNPKRNLKNPMFHQFYNRVRLFVRHRTHNKQVIHRALKRIHLLFESYYFRFDEQKQSSNLLISPDLSTTIDDYYRRDKKDLEDLIHRKIPW